MFSFSRHLIAVLLALVAIGAGSYAVYSIVVIQKSINGTGSINASPGLSVLDSACSAALNNISFPSLAAARGSTSLTVCVKNTGGATFYLESNSQSVSFSGLASGVTGTSSLTSAQQLAPGATDPIILTLTNDGSAAPGAFAFTLTFTGYSTSTG
jgi:archaellum component FlaG (FlaF/FlaG flagellin family)